MQAQPARIMGSIRESTDSARKRGVLRRHVVGSAALAARKEHAKCTIPQPAKTHVKCVPGATACRRDPIDRNEFCAVATLQRCSQQCASNAPAPRSTRLAPFSLMCEHAKCVQGGAVSPLPGVIATNTEPSVCATASSVDFAGHPAGFLLLRLEEYQQQHVRGRPLGPRVKK